MKTKSPYGVFTKEEFKRMQKMTPSERKSFEARKKKEIENKKRSRW